MNKKQVFTAALIVLLCVFVFHAMSSTDVFAQAEFPLLSMPVEYLNYTIVAENETLWAKIDGTYPMHLPQNDGDVTLPMVYPTPPNTTNMHVWLDDVELSWGNYSDIDPTATHYTDIGEWQMIYCTVAPEAEDFVLRIHYEHPVEVINGTYTFLYDLNIISYLSPESPNSTAHFNIRLETNCSGVNVYTTGFNGTWTPKDYTTTTETVSFNIVSEYNKPLLGDIAITLTNPQIPEFPPWILLPLLAASFLLSWVFFIKIKVHDYNGFFCGASKSTLSLFRQSETAGVSVHPRLLHRFGFHPFGWAFSVRGDFVLKQRYFFHRTSGISFAAVWE